MKLPLSSEVVASLPTYEVLRSLRREERRAVEDFLRRLVRQPAVVGDFEAVADDGRVHQVKVFGDWMLSYRVDHPAREIRVTGLEPIE